MATNQRGTQRIRSGKALVRISSPATGAPPMEARDIMDVSVGGMGVKIPYPLAQDQELLIELYHPILERPMSLPGRAAWCRMVSGDPLPNAGIEFGATNEVGRLNLRRIQAAEMSCRVISGETTVGFVVTPGENSWALYDHNTMKVATLARVGSHFQVTFLGARPEDSVLTLDAGSLPEAVALAFQLEGTPLIVPPEGGHWIAVTSDQASRPKPVSPRAEPAPEAAPEPAPAEVVQEASSPERTSLSVRTDASPGNAFHSVLAGGYHVGFVAVTSIDDVWSLYDESWNEVALIAPAEGKFKVTFVGGPEASHGASESLDYIMAKSFLGGVALAFDLKVDPELDPPLSDSIHPDSSHDFGSDLDITEPAPAAPEPEPEEEDEEAPLPTNRAHHCILDQGALVGYVAESLGLRGVWSVYNTMREKVAMVAPDESNSRRFKIMFIGGNPEDSIDYMVARSLKGAFALTFDLESLPKLDPPLDAPGRT